VVEALANKEVVPKNLIAFSGADIIKLFDLKTGTPLAKDSLPLPVGSIVKSLTGRKVCFGG
jgi:hypothetical protein